MLSNKIVFFGMIFLSLNRLIFQKKVIGIYTVAIWGFLLFSVYFFQRRFSSDFSVLFIHLIFFTQSIISLYCLLKSGIPSIRILELSLFLSLFGYINGYRTIYLFPHIFLIFIILLICCRLYPVCYVPPGCIGIRHSEGDLLNLLKLQYWWRLRLMVMIRDRKEGSKDGK